MNTYQLTIGDQKRDLPIIPISKDTAIASFVLLGDDAMSYAAAKLLLAKLPRQFDYLVTVETKGISLAHDLALLSNHPRSLVIRKSVKSYMKDPLVTTVNSITTDHEQTLVLDGNDAARLANKRVVLVDDVVSTGGSLRAAEHLLRKTNCRIVDKLAILAEGAAARRTDIQFIKPLPLFNLDGAIKPVE
ncbi:phosphoribosyltransferase family protein [Lactobacillus helveticus]|uniref:phosphoribosyltransferase family protein n=1 Tax=Lactobacillus helveticus TaxID=1587 RepID=UPI0015637094|nr:phosphoribosyltransferase family protein [Lactobacillus helveticus]MBN6050027.1 adenine phosphoribosyltransferase [Lactobacillus helveticus]MCO0807789.1 adenine phosphoribosyltransferase [Lactobacillus helveticus]MCP9317223.1 adenine phosphoribosyltransferase [Lactobacillus helveticus]MDH5818073.1 phosphoribosyltransferase family protein [Lactobacillus helveticus]NRO04572.1 Orotate phosphoribosyltransferase [Lactobacillus helveticus]